MPRCKPEVGKELAGVAAPLIGPRPTRRSHFALGINIAGRRSYLPPLRCFGWSDEHDPVSMYTRALPAPPRTRARATAGPHNRASGTVCR